MDNRTNRNMDEQELLQRLENERQEDMNNGSGSPSLQSIVSNDENSNFSPTKLIPIILTIIGGIYIGAVQIYTFTSALEKLEESSVDNVESISTLTTQQETDREYMESLVYDLERTLDSKVSLFEEQAQNNNNRISSVNEKIQRLIRQVDENSSLLSSEVSDLREQLNSISNYVSELETQIRIMKIESEYFSNDNGRRN